MVSFRVRVLEKHLICHCLVKGDLIQMKIVEVILVSLLLPLCKFFLNVLFHL